MDEVTGPENGNPVIEDVDHVLHEVYEQDGACPDEHAVGGPPRDGR